MRTRRLVYAFAALLVISAAAPCSGADPSDISIAGVSMALVQREEFASSLQRNGGDLSNLIGQLEQKTRAQQSR